MRRLGLVVVAGLAGEGAALTGVEEQLGGLRAEDQSELGP